MTKKIKNHLKQNPSYLKWGVTRLANRFNCSERTMKTIVNELKEVKQAYMSELA
mgnify:CR=1 FL=1